MYNRDMRGELTSRRIRKPLKISTLTQDKLNKATGNENGIERSNHKIAHYIFGAWIIGTWGSNRVS
jgi:hypothetical protein